MSSRLPAGEVRDLLRSAFCARMAATGWEVRDARTSMTLVAFSFVLDAHFAATFDVTVAGRVPDKSPVLLTDVRGGVSYEPLRELSPLLDRYEVSVLSRVIWPRKSDRDAGEGRVPDHLEIATAADAERAAERLVPLAMTRSLAFAERHASFDGLLSDTSDSEHFFRRLTGPALLAAAGRLEEAQVAFDACEIPSTREGRVDRRLARQLRRFIASGGDRSLIPERLPPSRREGPPDRSLADLRTESRAERAALAEVQDAGEGLARENARVLLLEALARRGVDRISPLAIEFQLDHLFDSPADRLQTGIKTLGAFARFGVSIARTLRSSEMPLLPPDWLEPPDDALYEIARSDRWTAVDLDAGADAWLDRVHEAAFHMREIAALNAWLSDDDRLSGGLAVHIGRHRVGSLPPSPAGVYTSVMADAAQRDEHACLVARLGRLKNGFFLEVEQPG